ncbi:MAG: SH3 domain-containing protein [Lachnospiraceae bacterium]|nr:SH3 domain-containing protein [Lachnospiraceae bacterium]
MTAILTVGLGNSEVDATNVRDVLPAGGVALALGEGLDISEIYIEQTQAAVLSQSIVQNTSSNGFIDAGVEEVLKMEVDVSNNETVLTDMPSSEAVSAAAVSATSTLNTINASATADSLTMSIQIGAERSAEMREVMDSTVVETVSQEDKDLDPENFSDLVIAQVTNYVNVRDIPSEEGEIVGKLYDDSVGNFIEEENGWYKITSGRCTGYVKAEYCVTGEAAIELAREVGTRVATVNTTTLKVRTEPSTESSVLGLVPIEEDLSVLEELDGWVKVSIEEGEGYVSAEYVNLRTDFVVAESRAEEEARLERERQEREAAQAAARAAQASANRNTTSSGSHSTYTVPTITGDNSMGVSVAQYACQFVGNPYVYGGSSLTNGTDCSGFVMSVYAAFGVSLPHSSTADRSRGYAVEGGVANAQPGDIICYSGHVGIYIGNGQIVHASNERTGIIISNVSYRSVLAVRRIF